MAIQAFPLGDFSAENDSSLSEYFLEDTQTYMCAEDIDDKRYILLGRTGSGKSAILSHVYEKFRNDNRYICAYVRPGKSYLDAIVQTEAFHDLKQAEGLQHILYKLIWHYIIMISVLREKYGANGPLKRNMPLIGEDLKAYKFLRKVQELSREDQTFFDIISDLIQEISISLKGITIKGRKNESTSPYQVMRDLVKETEDFHKKGFWKVVGGSKLYLLFDDLDLGWNPKSEDQQLLLRGLFEIMKDYVYRDRVKPLIALRTDILDGLSLPQKEKFENNILVIRWTKVNLERMLLLRLKNYGGLAEDDEFDRLFSYSEEQNPIDYMISRTLYRPRDLLAFCTYAINDASETGSSLIQMNHVITAEKRYANSRLQALTDEWRYLYPCLNLLAKLLIKIIKNSCNLSLLKPKELREVLIETKLRILTAPDTNHQYQGLKWFASYFPHDDQPDEIVQVLYRLGFIGYRQSVGNFIFSYEIEEMLDNVDKNTEFQIHPMLQSIPTNDFSFEEDENPWM
ncbi:P-loop ATPase, Sll1717 family [Vacuolonema iberomarrocanum]|uniref:P-loop ATPase, Sll1717 family n=1 Tax=Vacuolonema iberomarrocanum TaxID=3454632 RepID=UPI0019FBCBD6|nr:hypothetical protein [filamentous cyanobacterium LEGE 07170]